MLPAHKPTLLSTLASLLLLLLLLSRYAGGFWRIGVRETGTEGRRDGHCEILVWMSERVGMGRGWMGRL